MRDSAERILDVDERAELGHLARRVRSKPIWVAIPLTLWFWPMFLSSVAARKFPSEFGMIVILFMLGSVTIYWEWQVFAGAKLSRLLRQDQEAGIVQVEDDGDEVLPISRMGWIVEGEAAPWRGHAPPRPEVDPADP